MAWQGYDEKYVDTPFTNRAVAGVLGTPLAKANEATKVGEPRNADGYELAGDMPKAKMKKTPLTEPLPPSILEAIRQANKAKKDGKNG